MKKAVFSVALFLTSMFVFGIENVEAKQCTGIYAAPHLYQVTPYKVSPTYDLYTSYSSCQGVNTEVWFTNIQTLPNSWTFASGNIYIDLYEEDPPGNDDEHVKSYVGFITNRTITSLSLMATHVRGNIDSAGDQKCELYLKFGSSGQYGLTIEKSLFNYQICMN